MKLGLFREEKKKKLLNILLQILDISNIQNAISRFLEKYLT